MSPRDHFDPDAEARKYFGAATVSDFEEAKRSRAGKDRVESRTFSFVSRSQLKIARTCWLVKPLLEADCVAVLIGEPETYKSFLALDIAMCIASGTSWHGRKVRQGPVLYIAGEGQTGLAKRISAWELHHKLDLTAHPIMFSTMPTALTDPVARAILLTEIERATEYLGASPALVVADTLSRNFGPGDENSTADMQRAGMTLDAVRHATQGGTVLVVHHSGHADKTRGRGSSVLWGNSDAEYLLVKDEVAGIATLTARKTKDGPRPQPVSFKPIVIDLGLLDDDGDAQTSLVLTEAEYAPPKKSRTSGMGNNQQRALGTLRDLCTHHRNNVAASGRDPDMARVTIGEWRSACNAFLNRFQFRDAREGLLKAGLISIEGDHVRMRENRENGENPAPSHIALREGRENPLYRDSHTSHESHTIDDELSGVTSQATSQYRAHKDGAP